MRMHSPNTGHMPRVAKAAKEGATTSAEKLRVHQQPAKQGRNAAPSQRYSSWRKRDDD